MVFGNRIFGSVLYVNLCWNWCYLWFVWLRRWWVLWIGRIWCCWRRVVWGCILCCIWLLLILGIWLDVLCLFFLWSCLCFLLDLSCYFVFEYFVVFVVMCSNFCVIFLLCLIGLLIFFSKVFVLYRF